MCGADTFRPRSVSFKLGSSPRVRSRHGGQNTKPIKDGIISACAEQTLRSALGVRCGWDHLRVCGADNVSFGITNFPQGSSPRVRSRQNVPLGTASGIGIISACAEQTPAPSATSCRTWDHLRVCGADAYEPQGLGFDVGSSPRVRSRRLRAAGSRVRRGIISACAEQTPPRWLTLSVIWDHLRVCGADDTSITNDGTATGSSPRVRSRLVLTVLLRAGRGIISACAEQTRPNSSLGRSPRDHLRVCGADYGPNGDVARILGSSPRVRSRLAGHQAHSR